MPKSKVRKTKKKTGNSGPSYGSNMGQTSRKTNWIIGVCAVVLVVGGGWYWWRSNQITNQIVTIVEELARQGADSLADVHTIPVQGGINIADRDARRFAQQFPTSGYNTSTLVRAGFYKREMPRFNLVHTLEHGNIIIYYDAPGEAAIESLKEWSSVFRHEWGGVIATLSPGLGETVVMTAWTKLLPLEKFDAMRAAAFVDAFRGRGPKNPVR